ncbi:gp53-like domain-containing protein [Brucella pituitosa]|uniref:Putative tail fiber protein gp53-like C-terminal domain-containing protein n=1 Tax=Brucella pituitosa TaxID=571256 RepID=A0ABS3K0G9_9HYPH|nr:hypothetical protein [Brucella pituitosa]MBO1040399.1 hypothetical protein [Brucella pituitosa]
MAVLSDYTSGTITLANGSMAVTGTGTLFDVAKFREGDTLQIQNLTAVIASVDSNTSLMLTAPWTGSSLTNAPYRARYLPDGARVTAQATTLIELLGNGVLSNLAELGVEDGKVPVGNAAGEYELVDVDELGIQDPNGSLGKLAALTLAANKILNTDASGNLTQSDITAAALVLLKLAGTAVADKLPFFDSATTAALTDFTIAARALTNLTGTPAANMLPYLTGASGAGLTPLTDFARTVLDDASGSAMFTTMGGTRSPLGNGYQQMPNGTLFQWGNSNSASTDYRINFPTGFPTACTGVSTINTYDYGGALTNFIGISTSNVSTSGFDARCRVIGNGGIVTGQSNVPLLWMAVGI